jgi:16S rRNA (guanine527-N7)-methyltransferase
VEHDRALREFTACSAEEIGVTLDESHLDQLMHYLKQLLEWNNVINLTGITNEKEIIVKHFVDSLAALVSIRFPQNAVVLDIGTGAGFPGIPLKIVRSDLRLILIEPVQKKCSFLNFMIGLFKLEDSSVFEGTVEQYAKEASHNSADIAVIRALRFDEVEEPTARLLRTGGKMLLYRTESIRNQRLNSHVHFHSETSFVLPLKYGERVISVLEKQC